MLPSFHTCPLKRYRDLAITSSLNFAAADWVQVDLSPVQSASDELELGERCAAHWILRAIEIVVIGICTC